MAIDIGNTAINRDGALNAGISTIDLENVSNASGIITSVDVWFQDAVTDNSLKIGTFQGSGTSWAMRDYTLIGNCSAGSKQTFVVSLLVGIGDAIGCYFATTGLIEKANSGGTKGKGIYTGDAFADNSARTFSINTTHILSIGGTGTEVSLPNITKHNFIPPFIGGRP
jgi:hypothetical protein